MYLGVMCAPSFVEFYINVRRLEHCVTYRSRHPNDDKPFDDFPCFESWIGRLKVPNGVTLRRHFQAGYYAKGSAAHEGNQEMSRWAIFALVVFCLQV